MNNITIEQKKKLVDFHNNLVINCEDFEGISEINIQMIDNQQFFDYEGHPVTWELINATKTLYPTFEV